MDTFCIQKGHHGRETTAIRLSAEKLGARCIFDYYPSAGQIPIGTVEFCQHLFGPHRIDFFPDFLRHMLHREISSATLGMLYAPMFVKDGSGWKSEFESGVRPCGTMLVDGKFWVSEVVEFTNEWRYYVANGQLVTTGWYGGVDEDQPAPDCGVAWPEGFSGAVDFGTLPDGRLALVECHAPFACGWYGETHEDYARWQLEGWKARSWWADNQA